LLIAFGRLTYGANRGSESDGKASESEICRSRQQPCCDALASPWRRKLFRERKRCDV